MTTLPRGGLVLGVLLIVAVTTSGCGKSTTTSPAGPGPMGGPPGGGDPKVKQAMNKIGKGPTALGMLLDQELKADQPAWETIQPQAAEYAQLAGEIGQSDPPKGSKESWTKLCAAFSESATALNKAAQAKDLAAARTAQKKLGGSCMECHREHRGGPGGGPGGPRGPGGPGGPRGPDGPAS